MATSNDHRKVTKRSSNAYVHYSVLTTVSEWRSRPAGARDAAGKRSNVQGSNHARTAKRET
jgi:hypothetical protein